MSLTEGVAGPIQLDIFTCYAVGTEEQGSWAIVHCVGALLSLISFVAWMTCSCSTKGHPGPLYCKQGQCKYGNLSKVPFDGCLLVTVVTMLKSSSGDTQHSVESLSFLWPQIHLYNAMFVLFFIQISAWRKQVYHRLDTSWGNLKLCCC